MFGLLSLMKCKKPRDSASKWKSFPFFFADRPVGSESSALFTWASLYRGSRPSENISSASLWLWEMLTMKFPRLAEVTASSKTTNYCLMISICIRVLLLLLLSSQRVNVWMQVTTGERIRWRESRWERSNTSELNIECLNIELCFVWTSGTLDQAHTSVIVARYLQIKR